MPARRTTSTFAALILAIAAGSDQTQVPGNVAAPTAVIVAASRLRQGDPLLAWIVVEAATSESPSDENSIEMTSPPVASGLVARLIDPAGKIVSSALCFAAPGLATDATATRTSGMRHFLFGALMGIPLELPPGTYELVAGSASVGISVDHRSFPLETVKLDEANAAIRTVPDKRKDDEARRLYELLSKVDEAAIYAEPSTFLFPVEGGWRSAGFGDARRYLYPNGSSGKSIHEGIDWAVVTGTAVLACARGKVAMAADREATGKTLVIEHLPGLYSLYFHLSSIDVEEGAMVERGERIALTGSTGMSTGPHLHWELRARGEAVDPEYWLGSAILDKDAVNGIISGLIEGR